LHALGVAPEPHIRKHYIRGCYPELSAILRQLESEVLIERVKIVNLKGCRIWPGTWYIHADDLPLLERLAAGDWEPRTTLLSPFDNLISDRRRTEQVFDFRYRFEFYTPKHKRKYGAYVLPILHGDRFIGRIDPKMDRKKEMLLIKAIYTESDSPMTTETTKAVSYAFEELGEFLDAKEIIYDNRVPDGLKSVIH
jgi:uncharacterized protein YcaQ